MAELRFSRIRRKRKLITDIDVVHISDDELESSQEDSDVEIVEKNAKIRHVDLTDSQNSNLEISSSTITEDCEEVEVVETDSVKANSDIELCSQELISSQDVEYIGSELPNGTVNLDCDVDIVRRNQKIEYTDLKNLNSDTLTSSLNTVNCDAFSTNLLSQEPDCSINSCTLNSCIHAGRKDHINIKQKLIELEEEIQKLKAENQNFSKKKCECDTHTTTTSTQLVPNLIATITFNTIEDYNNYKNEFINAFQPALNFDFNDRESDLTIEVLKDDVDISDWVIIDDATELQEKHKKNKHKKKKKNREKLNESLFVLDTTPNVEIESSLRYHSKFSVVSNPQHEGAELKEKNVLSNCFNCNEKHNLRDCPQPKNFNKINAARQKFKGNQSKLVRYHLEDDQKFAHLKPGVISEKLRHALGLHDDQLPVHVYKMRQIGYPPGWFEELQVAQSSNLVLFDFEGKNDFKSKMEINDVDPDKIVEYSGFNVPLAKGIRDEYRFHGCPPYSKECSKVKMLEYARKLSQHAKDNLESCDMDIEESSSQKTDETCSQSKPVRCSSPTLNDLENEKEKLLSELIDANEDSTSNFNLNQSQEEISEPSDDVLKTIDITGVVDDINSTMNESQRNSPLCNVHSVKVTRFGTPIISSLSPYSKLPRPENFQQDVSDVINFENLPNSTGKYEQMVGVLGKVRKELKRLNSL